jgi:hypothetical protein
MFSAAQPLYKLVTLDELLMEIPPSVFYGFVGGALFALFSIINRYRSADIPPGLVLQLGYHVLLSAATAYFAMSLSPAAVEPAVAFAVGFLPYGELAGWLRQTAQTRLGTTRVAPEVADAHRPGSEDLSELQGLSPPHRERLAEEGIHTVQDLALANPLSLYLLCSFGISQIIDWIDQAYVRLYVSGEAARQLAPRGIRGVIELAEAHDSLQGKPANDPLLASLAQALGVDTAGASSLMERVARDPQVDLLRAMWAEFGSTT